MATGESEGGWRGRLAEMEEQLHALAAELAEDLGDAVPEPEPPPAPEPPPRVEPPPAFEPPPRVEPVAARVEVPAPDPNAHLEAMCARLLAAMREMLAGYELALTHVVTRGPAVTVAAGPFGSVALLERFEDALRALPDVSEVAVRGYEGRDRALLEVHLRE
jgi:hypothetical protein